MKSHVAIFAGKQIELSEIPLTRQFREACQLILDSGADGTVICPDGRRYDIKQRSTFANQIRKVVQLERLFL